jgi:hypothetical protein
VVTAVGVEDEVEFDDVLELEALWVDGAVEVVVVLVVEWPPLICA